MAGKALSYLRQPSNYLRLTPTNTLNKVACASSKLNPDYIKKTTARLWSVGFAMIEIPSDLEQFHMIQTADHHVFILTGEHAGKQGLVEDDFT